MGKTTSLKFVCMLGLGLFFTSANAAADGYGTAGCGLGSMIFEPDSGFTQVFAATTNSISGNQTFGITSGTLGCTQDGVVRSPTEVRVLLMSSLDNLAVDMARGDGETLESLAALLEVEDQDKPRFFAAMQDNFVRIFPNEDVTAEEVLVSMNAVLAEDEVLSRYAIA